MINIYTLLNYQSPVVSGAMFFSGKDIDKLVTLVVILLLYL